MLSKVQVGRKKLACVDAQPKLKLGPEGTKGLTNFQGSTFHVYVAANVQSQLMYTLAS